MGDEVLARAVARVAMDRDWVAVGNRFLETRPRLEADLKELWHDIGDSRSVRADFEVGMVLSSLRPSELGSRSGGEGNVSARGEERTARSSS